jgi:hypothetical protein
MTDPNPTHTELTPADRQRIRNALGNMPYAGSVGYAIDQCQDIGDIVEFLNWLADTLRRVGKEQHEADAELYELRTQRNAVRAFLGIDKLPNAVEIVSTVAEAAEVRRNDQHAGARAERSRQ